MWLQCDWLLLVLLGSVACADATPQVHGVVLDSIAAVVLVEPEGDPIARASGLLHASDGSWYIADNGADQATRYAADGRFVHIVGRKGQGPGEFESPTRMARLGGDSIAVLDAMAQRIVRFAGDQPAGAVALPSYPYDIEVSGATGWIASINLASRTTLLQWDRARGALTPLGSAPAKFVEGGPLNGIFSSGQVVVWPDSVLTLIDGYPWARMVRATGEVSDSFMVPARLRRGTPVNLAERLAKAKDFPEMFASASFVTGAADVGAGWIALTHMDLDYDIQARHSVNPRGYLTLVNRASHAACVELPLADSLDAQPVVAFGRDTLYLLDRRINDSGGLTTTITSYRLHPDACPAEAVMEF